MTAKTTRNLYLPDRLMRNPDSTPPTAFPTTAGTRWAPATVLELLAVIWKYSGTENISCRGKTLAVEESLFLPSNIPQVELPSADP